MLTTGRALVTVAGTAWEAPILLRAEDARPAASDRCLPETRLLAAVVLPFLLLGAGILLLDPSATGTRFAWPVAPTMTAYALGSTYLAGAYLFARVLVRAYWSEVRLAFPAILLFTVTLGAATAEHWNRFSHGNAAIAPWVFLYSAGPVLVLAAYLRQRGQDPGHQPGEVLMPRSARLALAVFGLLQLATGVLLFAAPHTAAAHWPWTLTPLTARVLAGWCAWGLFGVLLSADGRWRAARVIVQAAQIGVVSTLVCAVRAHGALRFHQPATFAFLALCVAAAAGLAALDFVMQRRASAPAQRMLIPLRGS